MADEVSEPWLNASVFDESACTSILLDDFIARSEVTHEK